MSEIFRAATADDWPAIWSIFRTVVAAGETYPYPSDIAEDEAHGVWMPNATARRSTFVAVVGDEVVATCYVKANGVGRMGHVANAGWMVSPEARGQGIGRRFAEWTLDQAVELGFTHMQFNAVVASNTVAVRLWESLGFEIVGTVPDAFIHETHGPTPVHVMYRQL